jgi:hypothetical protein
MCEVQAIVKLSINGDTAMNLIMAD